jgi:PAS domain S-box-containing protein
MAICWGDDRVLLYNEPWAEATDIEGHDAIGRPARLVWPDGWDLIGTKLEAVMSGRERVSFRDDAPAPERSALLENIWLETRFGPIRRSDGTVGGVLMVSAASARTEPRDKSPGGDPRPYRALASHLPGGAVFLLDRDLRYVLAEGQALRKAGFDSAMLEDRTIQKVLDQKTVDSYVPLLHRALRGETFEYEYERQGRYYITFGIPIRDAADEVTHVLVISYDITERKRYELEMRWSEQRERQRADELADAVKSRDEAVAQLDAILDALPTGVVIADAEGRIIRDNAATRELWGVPPDTASWEAYSEWVGWWPETGERIKAEEWAMTRALLHGEVTRNELVQNQRFNSLERRYYLNNVAPLRDSDGRIVGGVAAMLDVTDRLAAQRDVQESQARLRAALDASGSGIYIHRIPLDESTYFDDRWAELLGYRPEELPPYYRVLRWILALIHPEDRASLRRLVRDFMSAQSTRFRAEARLRHKNGDWVWMESFVRAVEHDENGRIRRVVGVMTDITERKRAEEALHHAKEQLELRVSERTAELEQRAHQLARLTSELTMTEQRERKRLAQTLHDHLQQLLVGAKLGLVKVSRRVDGDLEPAVGRVAELVDEAIDASRSLTVELSPPVLHDAGLAAGLEWLARWMKERHGFEVQLRCASGEASVRENVRVLVFQSVRELLLNTLKHAEVQRAAVEMELDESGYLQITVTDHGVGFDPEAIGHAQSSSGGFGLFSIRERVALMGGRFEIESAPGQGSRFTLRIPRQAGDTVRAGADGASRIATSARRKPAKPAGRCTELLLVDDHRVVRAALRSLLEDEEDLVVVGEASNGLEALRRAHELQPDLVLMDFSMPVMDGIEATRHLRAESPHIQVIGLSMYDERDRSQPIIMAGAAAYVSKSGSPDELIETIRKVIADAKLADSASGS